MGQVWLILDRNESVVAPANENIVVLLARRLCMRLF